MEGRHLLVGDVGGADVVDPQAEIQGQALIHPPVVLNEGFELPVASVRERLAIGLGVGVDRSQERVGPAEVRVQRVLGVDGEVVVAARGAGRRVYSKNAPILMA